MNDITKLSESVKHVIFFYLEKLYFRFSLIFLNNHYQNNMICMKLKQFHKKTKN